MAEPNLTERQRKWFASIQSGLERDTGKSLAQWVAIARTCSETSHRARLRWLKDQHGLLQNRASYVLDEAFGSTMSWSKPEALTDALWKDPDARAVLDAINAAASALPDTIRTARKSFSAWSRKVQYAAVRPTKGGVVLGLAVTPETSARLTAAKNEGWSERLKSRVALRTPADVDGEIGALLKAAWDRS